jgi:hypothetical protein
MLARCARGLSTPPDEQFTRWIIILLKWPDMVRWLQSGPEYGARYYGSNTLTGSRLMKLADLVT